MSGHLFVVHGRSGSLIKVIWHDGQGLVCSGYKEKAACD
ncbi:MAG: hypothetical protein ROO70_14650 [Labrenzia sp.]